MGEDVADRSGAGTVAGVTRRLLLAAVAAVLAVSSCSRTETTETTVAQITTSTIEVADIDDVTALDPSLGVPVEPSGADRDTVEVSVESVRDLGGGRRAVSVFVAPCAELVEVTVDDGDATAHVADLDCSAERVLVTATVEAP